MIVLARVHRRDQCYSPCARCRDLDFSQNRIYPVCRLTRANLLASVRPGEFPLVFGHWATDNGAGALAREPIAGEHDGAVHPFAGISLEHRFFRPLNQRHLSNRLKCVYVRSQDPFVHSRSLVLPHFAAVARRLDASAPRLRSPCLVMANAGRNRCPAALVFR